ncbi:hypothetical protein BU26DRAFT_60152 [Trematosphaeria pertusa]|uniref:Uncharacterized protein n=1 Tax=Trematosphaeria pertusa TaxID=390896 RepID=A0A6A6I7G7_9PLEO|nr:uncharacterized protein BU26DRAFT_60152 [Trematosphaeria pertusa]KAF2246018.1 hypothetical protein BU26DRAFT_60152 [Trematosphaeria pertusa]
MVSSAWLSRSSCRRTHFYDGGVVAVFKRFLFSGSLHHRESDGGEQPATCGRPEALFTYAIVPSSRRRAPYSLRGKYVIACSTCSLLTILQKVPYPPHLTRNQRL